ncbi:MAG: alkaline phosphatase D family protein, partial [Bacteroidota bacterium]
PMVGYSTMKEVLLWVQTKEQAVVHFEYWNTDTPKDKKMTDSVFTQKENAYVAHLLADQLEPTQQYNYNLYINGKLVERPYPLRFESQPIWLWRHDAPDFSFAAGSCTYISEKAYDRPGKPYGSQYQIFENIAKDKPNFMLWLGDNFYLREADWNSKTGILHRYTHTRSNPEMQAMLGSMHHYAIWDDHDYGPNNSDRSYPMKRVTEKAFKDFFPRNNYIFQEGVTSFFQWNDCEFFLLDNRYWRTPNNRRDIKHPEILGAHQLEWLLDALVNSYATFKFVVIGGQFLNPLARGESHSACAPKERESILEAIQKLKINGVVFITGDVHHTELSKYDMEGGYPLHDLTVSPLTSGVGGRNAEDNPLQVSGTLVKEKTFAKIDVTGSKEERKLTIFIKGSNGNVIWKKEIMARDLKFTKD